MISKRSNVSKLVKFDINWYIYQHRHGKKKNHEEGHHHRKQKGRKLAEGHDSHHQHDKKYGKKGGHESGKKWFASSGH